jgi:hypothetical protein
LACSADIDRVFSGRLNSPVDVGDLGPEVPFQEETIALKGEVRRIARGLFGTDTDFSANTLAYKLKRFADS